MSDNNENKDSDEGINDENDPGVANGRNQVSHTANRIP